MQKYISSSRHIWRCCWFFHFLSILITEIESKRDSSMSSIAKEAYNVALGPNHPWIVRTVANAAMIACKSRENFMNLV